MTRSNGHVAVEEYPTWTKAGPVLSLAGAERRRRPARTATAPAAPGADGTV